MKILFLFVLLGMSQVSLAGQLHEIDVVNCPSLAIYRGDTLRFTNRFGNGEYYAISSTEFSYSGLSVGEYFDYTFTSTDANRDLLSDFYMNYTCGKVYPSQQQPSLRIRPAPVAIYPKQHVFSTEETVSISLFVLADPNGEYDSDIKQLSITVDGASFFKGSRLEYKDFIAKQTTLKSYSYEISGDCNKGTFAPPIICNKDDKGFLVTSFHIPPSNFNPGRHTIRAKLTLKTPNGDADYEDKAEYFTVVSYRGITR